MHLLAFYNRESFYQDTGCRDLAEKEQIITFVDMTHGSAKTVRIYTAFKPC